MQRGRGGREQRPCGVPRGGGVGSAVPLVGGRGAALWGEEGLRALRRALRRGGGRPSRPEAPVERP